jgi:hypothetical protein
MGEANAARLRDRLEARGDIDDFAEDIAASYDDLPDIDANPQEQLIIVGHASVAETDKVLDRQSAIEGGDRRGEFQKHRISGSVDGAPARGLDDRRNLRPELAKPANGAFLVASGQATVADDIGGDDSRQLAFETRPCSSARALLPLFYAPDRRAPCIPRARGAGAKEPQNRSGLPLFVSYEFMLSFGRALLAFHGLRRAPQIFDWQEDGRAALPENFRQWDLRCNCNRRPRRRFSLVMDTRVILQSVQTQAGATHGTVIIQSLPDIGPVLLGFGDRIPKMVGVVSAPLTSGARRNRRGGASADRGGYRPVPRYTGSAFAEI